MDPKQKIAAAVEHLAPELIALSHEVHAHPELGMQERQAVTWQKTLLEKYGFTVAKVADGEDFGLVRPDSPRWIITAVKQYTQEGEK